MPTTILRSILEPSRLFSCCTPLCQAGTGQLMEQLHWRLTGVKVSLSAGFGCGSLESVHLPSSLHGCTNACVVQAWGSSRTGNVWGRGVTEDASYSSRISFWCLECSWGRWLHSRSEWDCYRTQTFKWVITMWAVRVRIFFNCQDLNWFLK